MKQVKQVINNSLDKVKYSINTIKENQKIIDKINAFEDKWYKLMTLLEKYNSLCETFTLKDTTIEVYGFKAKIYCPLGMTFKVLDNIVDEIEDNFHCIFIYNKERLDRYIEAKFIQKLSPEKKFKPVPINPWEIYIGDNFDGSPIKIDLTQWCHVLVSGTTGGGKSKLLDVILSNQIFNCSPNEYELYLLQLDKVDLLIYEDAKVCKGFANNLDKSEKIIEYLLKENSRRDSLVAKVKKAGLGSNITDYNKHHPEDKQKTMMLVIDELASLSIMNSDNKNVKKSKAKILDGLMNLARLSRSNNIFLILSTQRATKEFIPPLIKAMCSLQISFRQNNMKSSEVAMDDSKIALGLIRRVAVYKQLDYNFLYAPFVSDTIILKYIKPKLLPGHKTIFSESNKTKIESKSNKNQQKKGKEEVNLVEKIVKEKIDELDMKSKKIDEIFKLLSTKAEVKHVFDKVNIENKVEDNIKNIEGFIPYKPIDSNVKVIDKTIINPSECSKPRKGKVKIK